MKKYCILSLIAVLGILGLSSCEKKPVDPPTNNQPIELKLNWVGLINGKDLPALGTNTFSPKSSWYFTY